MTMLMLLLWFHWCRYNRYSLGTTYKHWQPFRTRYNGSLFCSTPIWITSLREFICIKCSQSKRLHHFLIRTSQKSNVICYFVLKVSMSSCAERAFIPLPRAVTSSQRAGHGALQHQTRHEHETPAYERERRRCGPGLHLHSDSWHQQTNHKVPGLHTTSLKASQHTAHFVFIKPSSSVTHSGRLV